MIINDDDDDDDDDDNDNDLIQLIFNCKLTPLIKCFRSVLFIWKDSQLPVFIHEDEIDWSYSGIWIHILGHNFFFTTDPEREREIQNFLSYST